MSPTETFHILDLPSLHQYNGTNYTFLPRTRGAQTMTVLPGDRPALTDGISFTAVVINESSHIVSRHYSKIAVIIIYVAINYSNSY